MHVPFSDLTKITKLVKKDYLAAVEKLLDSGYFILGQEVEEFERQWAEFIGTRYCVGVSSGADALFLALAASGIGPGDEVITQGNAYNASVTAILRVGATPRFTDIHPETLQIDFSKIEALINAKTKAILLVHLYGQSGNIEEVTRIAKKHNLKVIEDCAQAHGSEFGGKKLGSFGLASAFSFYPTKNLGAFGDAGAVVTNDEKIYQELLARRDLGQTGKNHHAYLSTNMRLDPIQAVALKLKLKHLDQSTKARQSAGQIYDDLFKKTDIPAIPLAITDNAVSVRHLYVIILPQGTDRPGLQKKLLEDGVQTAVHYPVPVYRQPFYQSFADSCPITDDLAERILSLPLFDGITKDQQEYVAKKLKKYL